VQEQVLAEHAALAATPADPAWCLTLMPMPVCLGSVGYSLPSHMVWTNPCIF